MERIIVNIEPSKRLSELCGFPYFIERSFDAEVLLRQGVVNKDDIKEMRQGKEVCRKIPIWRNYG